MWDLALPFLRLVRGRDVVIDRSIIRFKIASIHSFFFLSLFLLLYVKVGGI